MGDITLVLDARLIEKIRNKLKESGLKLRFISKNVGSGHTLHFNDELTDETKAQIRQAVRDVVVADRLTGIEEYDPLNLKDVTKEQLANHIENNVTDLASAKQFLHRLAWLTLFLYKRLMRYE